MIPKPSKTVPQYMLDGVLPREGSHVPAYNGIFDKRSLIFSGTEHHRKGTFFIYKLVSGNKDAQFRMFPSVVEFLLKNTNVDIRNPDVCLTFGKRGNRYALTLAEKDIGRPEDHEEDYKYDGEDA